MITPAMRWAEPSPRVPDIAHSLQITSPSTAVDNTVAVTSGTAEKICCQLWRTCSRPENPRAGCTGVSLR